MLLLLLNYVVLRALWKIDVYLIIIIIIIINIYYDYTNFVKHLFHITLFNVNYNNPK